MVEKVMIDLICDRCKGQYQISKDNQRIRTKRNIPNLCQSCMKEHTKLAKKNWFSNLSKEDQEKFRQKHIDHYQNLSDQDKEKYAQRTKDQLSKRSKEEWNNINKKNSKGLKRHWRKVSDKDKMKRVTPMIKALKDKRDSLTDEEKSVIGRKWWINLSEEEKAIKRQELSQRMKEYNATLSMEEKLERSKAMSQWHQNLSEEEKKELYKRTHKWYHDLTHDQKILYAMEKQVLYDNLTNEQKATLIKKRLSSSGKNNLLHQKFEEMFSNSHLINEFYLKPEIVLFTNKSAHSWDYGIYNLSHELVAVVDLDGSYFHADSCDYDGIHSKEEYDEKRSQSIPEDSDIIHFIIQEGNIGRCFKELIELLMINYDEYVEYLFKHFRSIPFPELRFSDKELLRSYDKLYRMDCNDKYHNSLSLNTRIGDRLIQHFHPSIYRAHRDGELSPYDAWMDDELLKECIKNRIIYQSHLNPNKILQGFNVSKIAPKVSVFSAGRAKMIIYKYLSQYNEIFDPFSGFSGRMLGAISLGKRYIGQDISQIHVNESNLMIEFLKKYDIQFEASIIQQDIFESTGEYECLFTCSPYNMKENWDDVELKDLSCDDWIDECLSRFKCERYVFIVDNTVKYKEYIVDEIVNKSHFSGNKEYVIMINK